MNTKYIIILIDGTELIKESKSEYLSEICTLIEDYGGTFVGDTWYTKYAIKSISKKA